ncbi:homoserine dehydrogenase [Roseivirga sp. BDSF3-8]|uniref:homoserine dehydrogenase n=1 Tax=Roseivirga sp. BDSF3-8 TaxID=3241598 RepID=UPI0035326631
MSNKKQIGLFGFGCVGQGFYDILQASDVDAEVKKIGVIHPGKKRPIAESIFSYDPDEILEDDSIDLIVEAITDHESAFTIVSKALEKGIPVVTANKKMVATYLPQLLDLQKKHKSPLLYEASCCGAVPIVRTLEDYYGSEPLQELSGIFNGSSNFILTKMRVEGISYDEAVKEAQDLGFAEADPTLDVGGFDSLNKLCILVNQAYGIYLSTDKPFRHGIQNLSEVDLSIAEAANARIKLLAEAKIKGNNELSAIVAPVFVSSEADLYGVEYEYNAVQVTGEYSGNQLYRGKGAGGHPTGSAVFADTLGVLNNYRYGYAKTSGLKQPILSDDLVFDVYLRGTPGLIPELENKPDFIATIDEEKIVIVKASFRWLKEAEATLEESGLFLAVIPEESGLKESLTDALKSSVAMV